MKCIRIDAPGAGERILKWAGGARFRRGEDHSLSSHDGDRLLGGFVFTDYMGNAISVHDGSCDPRWCSRELLGLMFGYAFRQLRCGKLVAPVASDNHHALALNLRAGFKLEAILRDLIRPGCHLMVLTMTETECHWLDRIRQQYLFRSREAQDHG